MSILPKITKLAMTRSPALTVVIDTVVWLAVTDESTRLPTVLMAMWWCPSVGELGLADLQLPAADQLHDHGGDRGIGAALHGQHQRPTAPATTHATHRGLHGRVGVNLRAAGQAHQLGAVL